MRGEFAGPPAWLPWLGQRRQDVVVRLGQARVLPEVSGELQGHPVASVRSTIEVSVGAVGFALGGSIGVGTLAYAVAIGPLVHYLLSRLPIPPAPRTQTGPPDEGRLR